MQLNLIAYTVTPEVEASKEFVAFKKLTQAELDIIKSSIGIKCASSRFDIYKALLFCSKMAAICYMAEDFTAILNESAEASFKRLKRVLNSGHHSVFDHFKLTFNIVGIPKIIAMFLNNEKDYSTSEKSARFTKYDSLSGEQMRLYSKWSKKLAPLIEDAYPMLYDSKLKNPNSKIEKLAQENARYFVSVHAPHTIMAYTVSLRQINYLIYMFEMYIAEAEQNSFNEFVIPSMEAFISKAKPYQVNGLVPLGKHRRLSLIGDNSYFDLPDSFSYVYQTSYYASYACFAQVQRHRSEHCFLYNIDVPKFYIPEILRPHVSLIKEWLSDAKKVSSKYPQGQIVKIVQTGNIDTFTMKYQERCCGQTQLETMRHQVDIAKKIEQHSPYAYKLLGITSGQTARCLFKDGFCSGRCMLGSNQYNRTI